MKKILLIALTAFVAFAILFFVFASTQYGRVVIGVYQINAGLKAPRKDPLPIGLWHAVYTKDFAEKHNLPPENITDNLSDGVDYMEMETLPRTVRGPYTMCMVNMLVKKPHDISMWGMEHHIPKVAEDRKLLHLVDIQSHKKGLKVLSSMRAGSYDYKYEKRGFTGSTQGSYVENVFDGYDYFSANYSCSKVSRHPRYYPDGYGFHIRKASVWSKYGMQYNGYSDPNWPKDIKPEDSRFFIKIPEEIILNIFEKP